MTQHIYISGGPVEGLPKLQGSERQVAWANDIREAALRRALTTMCHVPEALLTKACDTVQMLVDSTSAHWWIEHRGDDFSAAALVRGAK